jgi:Arc/MetJ family transcription regulator
MAMTRIEIEIDDELVAEVMNRYGLKTVTEAVNYALRELAGPRLARQFLDEIEGIGWGGDLAEMRNDTIEEI